MLIRSLFSARLPRPVVLGSITLALLTGVWCHAGGPPLKNPGFAPRGSWGMAHHGAQLGAPMVMPTEWSPEGDFCPDSFTSDSMSWPPCSNSNGSTPNGSCCRGKCRHRQSDGITRHCGLPAPNYPVPFSTPRPTTPTLLWYPPMMPHNSLPHYRSHYSYRHGLGLSRTTVAWHPTYAWNAFDKLHHMIELPR